MLAWLSNRLRSCPVALSLFSLHLVTTTTVAGERFQNRDDASWIDVRRLNPGDAIVVQTRGTNKVTRVFAYATDNEIVWLSLGPPMPERAVALVKRIVKEQPGFF